VDPNTLTIRSYERYLTLKSRSPRTIQSYREAIEQLAAHHSGADVLELDRRQVEDYLLAVQQLPKRRAGATDSATAANRYRSLRAFYNWAVKVEELLEVSPMVRIPEPGTGADRPPSVVPDDHLLRLLKACMGTDHDARRDTAMIRLWCEPGSPRVSEMCGITLDDLDLHHDLVTIRGKGNKIRTIPFGAKAGQALERYLRVRAKHRLARYRELWLGARDRALSPSGAYQMLERRCDQAGIPRIHPHQLRHTAAHVWADSDGSEADAMALFGWSSPEMPRVYGRSAGVERAQRSARRRSLGDRL
jgi:site-specific recombinase XerD